MKFGVFVCGLIVALAQYSSADQICDYPINYTTALVPTCNGNEAVMKWPYYPDFRKYYACVLGEPILMNCAENSYFTYYTQQCLPCGRFIPVVECKDLKTINPPQCVPMGTTSTSAKPTTANPTTANPTTANPTTAKPTTAKPTTASPATTKTTPTTAKPETVPTPGSGGGIPTPPLIPTSAPGVPTPPVEPPTPPTVEETPEIRP